MGLEHGEEKPDHFLFGCGDNVQSIPGIVGKHVFYGYKRTGLSTALLNMPSQDPIAWILFSLASLENLVPHCARDMRLLPM